MLPRFLKNIFFRMLNPELNTIGGKKKLKKKFGLKVKVCSSYEAYGVL